MTAHYPLHQRIYDDVTLIQVQLDATLQSILTQAGNRIQIEQQAELQQGIERTKQGLETIKYQMTCIA